MVRISIIQFCFNEEHTHKFCCTHLNEYFLQNKHTIYSFVDWFGIFHSPQRIADYNHGCVYLVRLEGQNMNAKFVCVFYYPSVDSVCVGRITLAVISNPNDNNMLGVYTHDRAPNDVPSTWRNDAYARVHIPVRRPPFAATSVRRRGCQTTNGRVIFRRI